MTTKTTKNNLPPHPNNCLKNIILFRKRPFRVFVVIFQSIDKILGRYSDHSNPNTLGPSFKVPHSKGGLQRQKQTNNYINYFFTYILPREHNKHIHSLAHYGC
ncbi:unnamed protein product [Meloidogyne enterolobii]|uniref:Uncharacterized protein n=1 Tax=Meloidogyne enterolobii TaxID=390850 RepID=A0ACB0XYJ2_MELEN